MDGFECGFALVLKPRQSKPARSLCRLGVCGGGNGDYSAVVTGLGLILACHTSFSFHFSVWLSSSR